MKLNSKIKAFAVLSAILLPALIIMSMTKSTFQGGDVPEKYKTMKNPVKSDAASIAAGKVIYDKQCKMCHGVDGKKIKGKSDLTSKEFKAQTDGEIYFYTVEGIGKMPAYKNKIKEENDRWNVVNYMRSL